MKRDCKKYLGIVALIWLPCFLVFILVYLLVIRPQNQKLQELEAKLMQAEQLYRAVENTMQEKGRAELNRQLELCRAKIKDYVVEEKDSADLTFAISKIANERRVSNFNIRMADSQTASANTGLKYIYEKRISVDFSADFNQFAGFLNDLERYQPVIFVNDFKMSRSNENPTGHSYSMDLVVLVRKRPQL